MTRFLASRLPATVLAGCVFALLSACSSFDSDSPDGMVYEDTDTDSDAPGPGQSGAPGDQTQPASSLLKTLMAYDTDHGGHVTRAELEAGLHKEFDAADKDHDGKLNLEEMRAVNDKRWHEEGAAVTPLADWNGDGVVDFDEFAAGPRSLFEQLDKNHDGMLSPKEIDPRAATKKKDAASKAPPRDRD